MIKDSMRVMLAFFITGAALGVPFRGESLIEVAVVKSGLAGLLAGTVATFMFLFFCRTAYRYTVLAFSSVLIIVGAGAAAASMLLGVTEWLNILAIILLAETVTFIVTFYFYRKAVRLNKNLINTQKWYSRQYGDNP